MPSDRQWVVIVHETRDRNVVFDAQAFYRWLMADSKKPAGASFAVRLAIRHAFVTLLFNRRYKDIRVSDIIDIAGVGQSTFYNHFKSKDDVLLAVIEPIFTSLAAAAAGEMNHDRLGAVLEHFWEQRSTGRLVYAPELMPRLQRKLAVMIQKRLSQNDGPPSSIVATGRAADQRAMLHQWICGGTTCGSTILAAALTTEYPRGAEASGHGGLR